MKINIYRAKWRKNLIWNIVPMISGVDIYYGEHAYGRMFELSWLTVVIHLCFGASRSMSKPAWSRPKFMDEY